MKCILSLITCLAWSCAWSLAADVSPATPAKMASMVVHWDKIELKPVKTGARATIFEASTPTLDKFHCHVSTLNPGENTGAPHRHPQEELVVIKTGTLEVNINGRIETAETGSMIFYAANELENMRNPGNVPATYYVFQFFTPATPKN